MRKIQKYTAIGSIFFILVSPASSYAQDQKESGKFILQKGTTKMAVQHPLMDQDAELKKHLEMIDKMKLDGTWGPLGLPINKNKNKEDASTGGNYTYPKGLDISKYPGIGKEPLTSATESYRPLVEKLLADTKITNGVKMDANLILAIINTESGGNKDVGKGGKFGQGLMQIEYVPHRSSFYWCGQKLYGKAWNDNDFYIAEKNITYGLRILSELHKKYKDDYAKIIQGYNFSSSTIDLMVKQLGDDWINHRHEASKYNGHKGNKYGNPVYFEKVLSYYHPKGNKK